MSPVSHHSTNGKEEEARQQPDDQYTSEQDAAATALSLHQDQTRDIVEPATNLQALCGLVSAGCSAAQAVRQLDPQQCSQQQI